MFAQIANQRLGRRLDRASLEDLWDAAAATTTVVERVRGLHAANQGTPQNTFQKLVQRDLGAALGLTGEDMPRRARTRCEECAPGLPCVMHSDEDPELLDETREYPVGTREWHDAVERDDAARRRELDRQRRRMRLED